MTNPNPDIPADIEAAIDAFDSAAEARGWEACMRSVAAADAAELEHAERRAALDAAILARLTTAAEDDAEATCLHVRAEKTAEEIAYWQDAARHAEAERDHFRDKLAEMFGQLMLAEGSCAKLREEIARLRAALEPFAAICDAEHMKYVRDEQVLELVTRTDVIVSEKLRGRDFRAARAALTDSAAG